MKNEQKLTIFESQYVERFFLPFPRGGKGCEIWYCTVRFTVSLRL